MGHFSISAILLFLFMMMTVPQDLSEKKSQKTTRQLQRDHVARSICATLRRTVCTCGARPKMYLSDHSSKLGEGPERSSHLSAASLPKRHDGVVSGSWDDCERRSAVLCEDCWRSFCGLLHVRGPESFSMSFDGFVVVAAKEVERAAHNQHPSG